MNLFTLLFTNFKAVLFSIVSIFFWIGYLPGAYAFEYSVRAENVLAEDIKERCASAKEFITAYEYFKEKKEYGLNEEQIRNAAERIATGCTGAAERFVKIFELMIKAEAGPRSSLDLAIDLAKKPNEYAETFVQVFTKSYLAEHLDLDYQTSFVLAKSLSVDYQGNPKIAGKDFVRLVNFCSDDKYASMPKPRCGVIAGRIVKSAEQFQAQIADEFIQLFDFLVSPSGPSSPIVSALKTAEEVIQQGPEAAQNFIAMYKFSADESGLQLPANQAIQFAKKVASYTYLNIVGSPSEPGEPPPTNAEILKALNSKTTKEARKPASAKAP